MISPSPRASSTCSSARGSVAAPSERAKKPNRICSTTSNWSTSKAYARPGRHAVAIRIRATSETETRKRPRHSGLFRGQLRPSRRPCPPSNLCGCSEWRFRRATLRHCDSKLKVGNGPSPTSALESEQVPTLHRRRSDQSPQQRTIVLTPNRCAVIRHQSTVQSFHSNPTAFSDSSQSRVMTALS